MADGSPLRSFRSAPPQRVRRAGSMRRFMQRRSTRRLPDVLAADAADRGLVIYPALYAIYLSMLNRQDDAVRRPAAISPSCSSATPSSWSSSRAACSP